MEFFIKKFSQEAVKEWRSHTLNQRNQIYCLIIKDKDEFTDEIFFVHWIRDTYRECKNQAQMYGVFGKPSYSAKYEYYHKQFPWMFHFFKKYKILNTDKYFNVPPLR